MPLIKQLDNNPTAAVIIVLAILSSVAFGEDLKFCKGGKVTNRFQLKNLTECDVIVGHLIIAYKIFNSTEQWQEFGSLKVREITDYLVIYMVENLQSLDKLFPNLSVIRGHRLYTNYALIVYSNYHLEELKLKNLAIILSGSVFINYNNVLNGYVNKIDWYKITYWNKLDNCVYPNIIQESNDTKNCSKSCEIRDDTLEANPANRDEFCWSAEDCQKHCPFDSPCTTTGDSSGEPCHDQCLGGCFAPGSDEACVACKGFRKQSESKCLTDGCGGSLFELDKYVCVTDEVCDELGRKQCEILVNTTVTRLCVKECPNGYQESKIENSNKIICQRCKDGRCPKKCKGGLIDSISKAQKYQECTIVEGYLEIILFEANLTGELEKYLGNIELVSEYVRVFKSVALPSLQFFKKLRSIEGKKLWKNKYSLIVNDNDELQELWHNKEFILHTGEALFYTNPKLCPQNIEKLLLKNKYKEQFPPLNGNKKPCSVMNNLTLLLTPLDERKGVMKVQVLKSSLDDYVKNRLAGFHVYYKLRDSETNIALVNKLHTSSTPSAWSAHFQEYSDSSSDYLETEITGLEPARKYSFYIETLTVNSDNNDGSVQSKEFVSDTLPYYPSEPVNVTYSGPKNYTQVRWSPPLEANGVIHHYEISVGPYEEEQKKINLCKVIESNGQKGTDRNFYKGVVDEEGTNTSSLKKSSGSTCESKAKNPVDRNAEVTRMIDQLDNYISPDITFGRSKRFARSTDYQKNQMETISSQSGIRKRLSPRRKPLKNSNLLKFLGDFENATQPLDFEQYYKSMNLTIEEVCSLLKEVYAKDPRLSPHPFYMLICWKLEEESEPPLDDKNIMNESFVIREKRSIPESKKVAITRQDSVVVAEDYGGSYVMEDMKANSSYLVKIKACHKPMIGTKRCTGGCKCSNETYIIVHALQDGVDVRVQNLAIEPGEGDSVTVKWLPPKTLLGGNLAYSIKVKGPDGSMRSFCEISSYKTLNMSTTGNYAINVTAFSDRWSQNFSTPSEILYSFNNPAIISEYTQKQNISIIYAACFFVAVFLILAVVLLFRKSKKTEIPLSNFFENPRYIIMYPATKEYLYDKIPVEKLYSKKDFRKTGLAGFGKFGIVYKGALRVIDGTNKKKYIPVAAKQLINPMFVGIEHKSHIRVNEIKNKDRYNETKNQKGEYESSSQDNELINPSQINNQDIELTKQLIDEASLMLTLKSFHLVRTYGVMCENYELSIIMELMTSENLSSYLKKQRRWGSALNHQTCLEVKEKLKQVIKFGVQIADGMAYLSEKGVVHRDLAARNCLLDSNFNVKVSDFGMARVMQDNIYVSTGENKPVPVRWMPPEYFKEEKFVTNSDVYSYGIVLWEIVNPGEIPYKDVKLESHVQFKVIGGVTLIQSIPRWVPPQLQALIGKCWHPMPYDRPSFRDIVMQLLMLTPNNFREDFKKASFYYCGDLPEYEPEESYYPVPLTDDDDADPSTPLTTPIAETAFTDLNTTDYAQDDLPKPFICSILDPLLSLRNFWNKPRSRHRYNSDFSQLPFSISTSVSGNNKQSTVSLPSNKPDVLPVTSRSIPEEQNSRRQMEFA